ncbi:MAG: SH3 domain-containing protein [Rickettsiales bacterium]|jgi:uncharacterized protein YgiM (DUF1202 family)|nr:SH3 domain-containing protein [Rickettsiales bacterium]
MKKLLFIFFCLCIVRSATAATIVNVEVLNIRSCAGTHCNIVGKLNRHEKVLVENYVGEWVKVRSIKGDGFVIRTSLHSYVDNSYNSNITAEDIGIYLLILLGAAIFLLILFAPSLAARNNKNGKKIFWLNLLLFWAPLVWLILLVAALLGEQKENV